MPILGRAARAASRCPGTRFSPQIRSSEFPTLARAQPETPLDLWRGEALAGVPDGVLSVERDRLEDDRLRALEARIDAHLAFGAGRTLVAELGIAFRAPHARTLHRAAGWWSSGCSPA